MVTFVQDMARFKDTCTCTVKWIWAQFHSDFDFDFLLTHNDRQKKAHNSLTVYENYFVKWNVFYFVSHTVMDAERYKIRLIRIRISEASSKNVLDTRHRHAYTAYGETKLGTAFAFESRFTSTHL